LGEAVVIEQQWLLFGFSSKFWFALQICKWSSERSL